jgi:hypothetical protein
MVRANVGTCSWCAPRVHSVPSPCFNCGKPLADTDFTGAHRDKSVCFNHLKRDYHAVLRENQRLRFLIGKNNPVRCGSCGEIREQAEQMCGNCGNALKDDT